MVTMEKIPQVGHVTIFYVGADTKTPTTNRNGHCQSNGHIPQPIQEPEIEVEVNDSLAEGTQSSLITIFSMWNTMMGTSLLSMPWAIKQAGFANGIVLLVAVAGSMTYTAYRVITSGRHLPVSVVSEFSDVVRIYLGRFAEGVTILCSVVVFLVVAIVYWILMSSFLYHIVLFIYGSIHDVSVSDNKTSHRFDDVVCQNEKHTDTVEVPDSLKAVWDQTLTVPLFLCILVFPLINFKSPTFFTRFNALGTLSVTFLMIFVTVKASVWGIHLDFQDTSAPEFVENFEPSFPAMTGTAALAYFLQNAVMTIARNQKHPENNTRDLIIAYALVCFTYTFIGVVFYASFPLDKSCVGDNLLNNMTSTDTMSFAARFGFLFQMTCVLPLIIYVIRTQLLQFLFNAIWPSLKHVVIFNIVVVVICVLFAIFLPKIGQIISFAGAFCGVTYGIALPCLVYLVACHHQGTLNKLKLIFHCILIAIGVANFIAQFIILWY